MPHLTVSKVNMRWGRLLEEIWYYNMQITTYYNGNVQSHDQEESKSNSTINVNSGARTLTND